MKDWNVLYHYVLDCLKQKLPPYLTYHHWQHTLHVIEMSEFIAREENISNDDILLIKTAALFHDAGFIHINKGHEAESIRLAVKKLPEFGYNELEIQTIKGLIRATEIPQNPQNKLEDILADADLEYLGTDDFETIGTKLYLELKHYKPDLSIRDWNQIQIDFLQSHHYHTAYCIHHRTMKKEDNLQKLIHSMNYPD